MTLTTAKWTLEEYHRLAETGILGDRQVELLKGDIVEMASEGEPHAYSCHEAGEYLILPLGLSYQKWAHAYNTTYENIHSKTLLL